MTAALRREMRAAGGLLMIGLAVTGCTAGPEPAPGSTVQVTTAPGTAKGFTGARNDVTLHTCSTENQASHVAGKVVNPTRKPQTYHIYVALVHDGTTVQVEESVVRNVKPGAAETWSADAHVAVDSPTCILRVERIPVE